MTNQNNIEIGKRIKGIRKNMNMTMEKFGELFDPPVSKGTISKWENGKYLPDLSRLSVIAKNSNTEIDYILNGHKDLQGNEMPLPQLANYSYDFISSKHVIPKNASTRFIYTLCSIKDNNDTKGFIIRTTLITNDSNEIKEVYFEDFNEYDYYNFVPNTESEKKNFHEAIPINSNEDIVDFRWYAQHKTVVLANFVDSFFNKYVSKVIIPYIDFKTSNGSNIKINKEVKLYYINLFNHFIKIELDY